MYIKILSYTQIALKLSLLLLKSLPRVNKTHNYVHLYNYDIKSKYKMKQMKCIVSIFFHLAKTDINEIPTTAFWSQHTIATYLKQRDFNV